MSALPELELSQLELEQEATSPLDEAPEDLPNESAAGALAAMQISCRALSSPLSSQVCTTRNTHTCQAKKVQIVIVIPSSLPPGSTPPPPTPTPVMSSLLYPPLPGGTPPPRHLAPFECYYPPLALCRHPDTAWQQAGSGTPPLGPARHTPNPHFLRLAIPPVPCNVVPGVRRGVQKLRDPWCRPTKPPRSPPPREVE